MATQYAFGQIVTNGLVLSLDAADLNSYPGSGTTWTDLTGNANNATLINGPTFSSTNGGSIVFDGTNDNASLPNTSTFNFSGVSFSIDLFFNAAAWDLSWQALITKGDDSWRIHRYGGENRVAFSTTGLSAVDTPVSITIPTNTWYNFTCVYNGSSKNLYLNGVLDTSVSVTGTLAAGAYQTFIGQNAQQANRYFDGRIASVKIYRGKALSATEVLQNYNAQKSRFDL